MVATAVDVIVREFGTNRLGALKCYEEMLWARKRDVRFLGLNGKYEVEYEEQAA